MSIYEKCPGCGKKGFHLNYTVDPLQLCITPSMAYECRYCDYSESSNEYSERVETPYKKGSDE